MSEANLILLDLQGLDVILNINWLATNYALMDHFQKEVIFRCSGFLVVVSYRKRRDAPSYLILVLSIICFEKVA